MRKRLAMETSTARYTAHSTPSFRSASSCSAVSLFRLDLVLLYQMPSLVSLPSGKVSIAFRGTGRPTPSRSTHCARAVRPRWNACCALLGLFVVRAAAGAGTAPGRAACPASRAVPAARPSAVSRCPDSSASGATCPGHHPRTAPQVRCRAAGRRRRPDPRGRGSGAASPAATGSPSPHRPRPAAARSAARSASLPRPPLRRRLARCCPIGTIASPSPQTAS